MNSTEPPTSRSQRLRRWLMNVASGYASALVGGLIYLLLTPVIIHFLGVEAYAVLVVSHTIGFYLNFLDLGFEGAQIRYHARFAARGRTEEIRRLTSTIAVTLTIAGVTGALLALLIAAGPAGWWIDASATLEADFRIVLVLLAAQLLVGFPASTLDNLYEGAQRFDVRNLRSIVFRVATAVTQLVLLYQGSGIVPLIAVGLAATAIVVLVDIVILNRLLPGLLREPLRFDVPMWRRIRGFAFWNFLDDLMVEGSPQLGKVLVVTFLPLVVLTPYALCTTVAGALLMAIYPVSETLFPMIAAMHARGERADLQELLQTATKGLVAVVMPVAIILAFFGDALIGLWVPESAGHVPQGLMPVIVADVMFSVFLSTSAVYLVATSGVRTFVVLTLAELLLTLLLIIVLTPRHGVTGLALSAFVANLVMGFGFQIPIVARTVGTSPLRLVATTLARVLVICLPGVALAAWLRSVHPAPDLSTMVGIAAAVGLTCLAGLLVLGASADERARYVGWWRELRAGHATD